MVHRKDIVGIPNLVGMISILDELQLIGAIDKTAAAMAKPENRMRTPSALVGTSTCCDEVDAAHAVMFAPDVDVLRNIDYCSIGPGQIV